MQTLDWEKYPGGESLAQFYINIPIYADLQRPYDGALPSVHLSSVSGVLGSYVLFLLPLLCAVVFEKKGIEILSF